MGDQKLDICWTFAGTQALSEDRAGTKVAPIPGDGRGQDAEISDK